MNVETASVHLLAEVTLAVHERVVDISDATELPEIGGELLALVVWFVFGAIEQLCETSPEVGQAVATATLTLLLSIVLHGVSPESTEQLLATPSTGMSPGARLR